MNRNKFKFECELVAYLNLALFTGGVELLFDRLLDPLLTKLEILLLVDCIRTPFLFSNVFENFIYE